MRLTKNFTHEEIRCSCGKCDGGEVDPIALAKLQLLRDRLGIPMPVTSGSRCSKKNASVCGAMRSRHLTSYDGVNRRSDGFDIACTSDAMRYRIVALAISLGFTGIGVGKTFVHLDTRGTKTPVMWGY